MSNSNAMSPNIALEPLEDCLVFFEALKTAASQHQRASVSLETMSSTAELDTESHQARARTFFAELLNLSRIFGPYRASLLQALTQHAEHGPDMVQL